MELHPLSDYVAKGEEVARLNPHGFSKQAYLSSEDPTVFEEAQNITRLSDDETTSNMDWIWYTSSISMSLHVFEIFSALTRLRKND